MIGDGKPFLLAKTFRNGKDDPEPSPAPPPDASLASWIAERLPVLVASPNLPQQRRAVSEAIGEIVRKIDDGTITTPQNAQAQVRISVTAALAKQSHGSVDAWTEFLKQYGAKIRDDHGPNLPSLDEMRRILAETAGAIDPNAAAAKRSDISGARRHDSSRRRPAAPLREMFRL